MSHPARAVFFLGWVQKNLLVFPPVCSASTPRGKIVGAHRAVSNRESRYTRQPWEIFGAKGRKIEK